MPLTRIIYKLNVKIKNQIYINVNFILFLRTFIPDLYVRCNQNIFLLHDSVLKIFWFLFCIKLEYNTLFLHFLEKEALYGF